MDRPTKDQVLQELDYRPELGQFFWRTSWRGPRRAGARAGSWAPRGYRRVKAKWGCFLEHQLVWLVETGKWPVSELDHIDRNPANNVFCNLRECTRAQNCANILARGNKASGLPKGVTYDAQRNKYLVRMRNKNLGRFNTPEEAGMAYAKAAVAHYGDFAPIELASSRLRPDIY